MTKIFCIGPSRTGTKSLCHALDILGFKTIHFPPIMASIQAGTFDLSYLEPFDALADRSPRSSKTSI